MKTLQLSQGKIAKVDDDDFEWLSRWKWHMHNRGYAVRNALLNESGPKSIRMHRAIMNAPEGVEVDHIDHDKLNNQKNNLRLCTRAENMGNTLIRKDNTSGYKGVDFYKKYKRWRAKIRKDNQLIHIGFFDDPISAAKAYDEMAKKLFGQFANINFGEEG